MSERRNGGGRRDADRAIWSAFYWADYAKDTRQLSLLEHGAYFLLMGHYYLTGKPLPAVVEQLLRVCCANTDLECAAVKHVLSQFFYLDGESYRHKRIDRELKISVKFIRDKRIAGKKGGQASATARATATVEQHMEQASTQSQSHITTKDKSITTKKKQLREMPEDFAPKESHELLAHTMGVDLAEEFASFSDHHKGKGNRFKDWDLALNTWLRNARRFAGNSRGSHDKSARQEGAANLERALERLDFTSGKGHAAAMAAGKHE